MSIAAPERTVAASAVDLTKVYGKDDAEVRALAGVTIDMYAGEFTAVMGPSGSGKSTLMHCMAALDTPTSGSVSVGDTELASLKDKALTELRRDRVGFVFQAFNLVPTLTAEENIVLPLSIAGRTPDADWFDTVIDTVGLRDRLGHRPHEMSGGQQQRVACARALVSRPSIVFADEPTGNLDSTSSAEVLGFLRRSVTEFGQTVVMVTHDPIAASYTDRVVFLADGLVVDEMRSPDGGVGARAHGGTAGSRTPADAARHPAQPARAQAAAAAQRVRDRARRRLPVRLAGLHRHDGQELRQHRQRLGAQRDGATLRPRRRGGIDQVVNVDSRKIPASLVVELAEAPGVARADGSVDGQGLFVVKKNGKLLGGTGAPTLAFNFTDAPNALRRHGRHDLGGPRAPPATRWRSTGDRPTSPATSSATRSRWSPGTQPRFAAKLVGYADFAGGGLAGATLVFFDTPTAQDCSSTATTRSPASASRPRTA